MLTSSQRTDYLTQYELMNLPIYQVDAFASRLFGGNPAAVVPLESWLPDDVLAAIAAENNLSETAFVLPQADPAPLRWFTPAVEVDLCGHATLATAHVLFRHLLPGRDRLAFATRSGTLTVKREGELLSMDFPARPPREIEITDEFAAALGRRPARAYRARDLMAVFDAQSDVRDLQPDFQRVAALDAFAVIVTAPGTGADFVSRFFAPAKGIPEDPVTGSAHCTLIPYWAGRLGREQLTAQQLSRRGGELYCRLRGERVDIAGRAVEYLRGEITI
jgi:PhzF family phenazine biosynthesis protein